MSFDPETAGEAARALPHHETCLLLTVRQWAARDGIARSIDRARSLGCRGLDIETHRRLKPEVVAAVHAAGLNLYCWTVNRVSTARRLATAGIDGITTDRCAWMRRQLGLP